jgi:hypothetical protein
MLRSGFSGSEAVYFGEINKLPASGHGIQKYLRDGFKKDSKKGKMDDERDFRYTPAVGAACGGQYCA